MNTFSRFAFAVAVLFAASPSFAAPIIIGDEIDSAATSMGGDYGSYSSVNFANRVAGARHWGDELFDPGHRFDTTQISVDRNNAAHSLTLTMHTMFNGSDQGAAYADLFFDTASPTGLDNFGYAIALGYQTQAAGVYTVGSASTSNDLWSARSGVAYGGYAQFKTTSLDFDPAMAVPIDVRLNSGTAVDGFTVSVNRVDVGGGFFDLNVVLQAMDLSLFNAFDLLWATGDCGNDTLWGSVDTANAASSAVPAPPAWSLLGLGFLGLLALQAFCRRRAHAGTCASIMAMTSAGV